VFVGLLGRAGEPKLLEQLLGAFWLIGYSVKVKRLDLSVTLKERLALLEVPPPLRPCPVKIILDQLDTETSELLDRLLTKSRKSIRSIHSELHSSGIRVGRDSLANHRNGHCRCPMEEGNA
jgi:hypothetical protein